MEMDTANENVQARAIQVNNFLKSSVLYLPPANEVWGKVMFLHLSVSHSVHSCHRSGRYASYWNAYLFCNNQFDVEYIDY